LDTASPCEINPPLISGKCDSPVRVGIGFW
jgi:hypothetical protein